MRKERIGKGIEGYEAKWKTMKERQGVNRKNGS